VIHNITKGRRQVRIIGPKYFASYPSLDESAANLSLHHRLKKILGDTDDLDAKEIDRFYNCITYGLGAMYEADAVRRNMGIQFPSIFISPTRKWIVSNQKWSRCLFSTARNQSCAIHDINVPCIHSAYDVSLTRIVHDTLLNKELTAGDAGKQLLKKERK
jgi:hypothetical protein